MPATLTHRLDVDTLVDVHTHPFQSKGVAFSGVDDRDERRFAAFIKERFDNVHYASIVLSRSDYAARLWQPNPGGPQPQRAELRTQTASEAWPASDRPRPQAEFPDDGLDHLDHPFSRSVLALGADNLRRIMDGQQIVVAGVGGLGSLIAENLVQMGFQHLHLIDPDRLEPSNLNRIVGATYSQARRGHLKVESVARHLRRINPQACIETHAISLDDPALESVIAPCDWILLSTDTHNSRHRAQSLALRFFVPLIAAGVNITVRDGVITDMSGEVILTRAGDGLCLNCLGRIDPRRLVAETHPDSAVRDGLVQRGYVSGLDVKEPAVKTLNAILAALAVETLVDQYTGRRRNPPILVYENNCHSTIYPDEESLANRPKVCFACSV
ncbi:ThiF domain-containing protein [Gammaproteobacteria bacterium]